MFIVQPQRYLRSKSCESSQLTMEYESPSQSPHLTMDERLKMLYPMVNEEETPLPRCWSTKARKH